MDEGAKDFVAGVAAGVALVATGHPFDTVKVKLQAQQGAGAGAQYKGALQCAADIVRTQGVRGLYKGASSSLVGVAVESSLLFGTYTHLKRALQGSDATGPPSIGTTAISAGIAGGAVSLVLCPTELIKCRLQVQGNSPGDLHKVVQASNNLNNLNSLKPQQPHSSHHQYSQPLPSPSPSPSPAMQSSSIQPLSCSSAPRHASGQAVASSHRLTSPQGMMSAQGYQHVQPLLGQNVGHRLSATQGRGHNLTEVMSPTSVRSSATQSRGLLLPPLVRIEALSPSPFGRLEAAGTPSAARLGALHTAPGAVPLTRGVPLNGGMGQCSTLSSSAAHIQSHYSGPWDCAVKTLRQDGPQGLFRGLTATALRESIGNICFFLTYEVTKRRLTSVLQPWSEGNRRTPEYPSGAQIIIDNKTEESSLGRLEESVSIHSSEHNLSGGQLRENKTIGGQLGENRTIGGQSSEQGSAVEKGGQSFALRAAAVEAFTGVVSGGLAGIAFWCAVLPLDVVKTQIQTGTFGSGLGPSSGLLAHLTQLYRHSGLRGLYAGLGPTLWRAFPANAAAVVAWELTARLLSVRNGPNS